MLMETDAYLPLSGLQHLIFCERQCALIHVEGQWAENALTLQGRELHERAHLPGMESRSDVRIARAVHLKSERLGLVGVADIVEYHRVADAGQRERRFASPAPAAMPVLLKADAGGQQWAPFPVEYKRGRRGDRLADQVQLCAQAICLEEMHGCEIACGALFYGQSRRRLDVWFDAELRAVTARAAARFAELVARRETPRVAPAPKCRRCSLRGVCMPEVTRPESSMSKYIARSLRQMASSN
jgi:CRISPR-associated exonuclease Cas4